MVRIGSVVDILFNDRGIFKPYEGVIIDIKQGIQLTLELFITLAFQMAILKFIHQGEKLR